ncbi:MAG: histidine kinase [Chitinophagaceae bacterium]|nr:histidine kinase [Chitinophagaceae bacterium]
MENPYSGKSIIIGAVISGLILGGVNTYVVKQFGFSTTSALKDAVVSLQFWFLGALIIGNTIRFYFPKQSRIIFFFGLVVTLTALWSVLTGFTLHFVQRRILGYSDFFELSLPVRVAFTLLLFTALSMIFAFLNILNEQHLSEQRNLEAQNLARETELNNLQEKLHPHFLFNSLNSINALVAIQPENARKMVQQLSDFLRSTLKRDSKEWVNLSKELEYLSLYLEIEKVRFGHRLQSNISLEESTEACKLPPFILLPILENAIKFGLYDTLDEVLIELKINCSQGMLTIEVSNPFDPETAGNRKGTGYGLKAVNRRLFLLFGRTDLLQTKAEGNIFTTKVLIPQIT